jgi:hypothetical protein
MFFFGFSLRSELTNQVNYTFKNMFKKEYHPCTFTSFVNPQSRQSARLFLQSSELGLPLPLTRRRVCPSPGSGGRGTLAGERGVGRVPILTRGYTLWYSVYLHTVFTPLSLAYTVQMAKSAAIMVQ